MASATPEDELLPWLESIEVAEPTEDRGGAALLRSEVQALLLNLQKTMGRRIWMSELQTVLDWAVQARITNDLVEMALDHSMGLRVQEGEVQAVAFPG